jgi:TetR/AcrR family transcriptional regulator
MSPTKQAPKTVRREQQRAIESKQAIVSAALSEFADHGFDGASTRGITGRAGVKPRLINHYFGTKEGLLKVTTYYAFGLCVERLRRRQEGLEGVDEPVLLRLMLREFILFSAEVPEFHRFMMQANQGDSKRLAWLVRRHLARGSAAEIALLMRAQNAGLFQNGDAAHLRYIFIGAATSVFTFATEYKKITRNDPFDEAFITKHVDMVLSLFIKGGSGAVIDD